MIYKRGAKVFVNGRPAVVITPPANPKSDNHTVQFSDGYAKDVPASEIKGDNNGS